MNWMISFRVIGGLNIWIFYQTLPLHKQFCKATCQNEIATFRSLDWNPQLSRYIWDGTRALRTVCLLILSLNFRKILLWHKAVAKAQFQCIPFEKLHNRECYSLHYTVLPKLFRKSTHNVYCPVLDFRISFVTFLFVLDLKFQIFYRQLSYSHIT